MRFGLKGKSPRHGVVIASDVMVTVRAFGCSYGCCALVLCCFVALLLCVLAYGPCWWREKNEKKKKWGRAAAPKQFVWEKEGKRKRSPPTPKPARYDSLSIVFHHDQIRRRRHSTVESNIITIDLTCLLLHDD